MIFSIDRPGDFLLLFLKTVYQLLFTFASIFVFALITKRAKLLNADWSMKRAFFLNFA